MATFALEMAIFVLFFSVKTETNAQIITVPAELYTTFDLPCRCPICPESTVVVQWFRSSNSDVFVKDGKALASWYGRQTGSSQEGFGITDDFSMIMYSVNLTNIGLYRCIVTPANGPAECTHDVKLGLYANPDSPPVIEYIQQTYGFNVTCSISYVFPMTFPILTNKGRNGSVSSNRDGTYNTSVTQWFPANEKDTTIQCLYSILNFKSMSSLRIVDSDNIDQNTTHNTDCRPKPSGLWMVWILIITEVLFFSVIVYAIKTGRVLFNPALHKTIRNNTNGIDLDEHDGENSKEEEPAKSARNLLFGKLPCAVITLTIQIIILVFLVTYLATARCLIEAGGKLEGNVSSIKMDD